jgi:cyclophilin family peptidyl-prolyl cis-trans isomerase
MSSSSSKRPRAFLDFDVGGHRAAHALLCAFVEANEAKYGLSSRVAAELGGSERARLRELFEADHAWSGRGRIELLPAAAERVVVELYADAAPLAVENFLSLCAGDRGKAKGSGKPLAYAGCAVFRKTPGFAQLGDFSANNGAGGESIWGGTFKDEKGGLALKHDKRGLLSMSNSGPNKNGSQFFITFQPMKHCDKKHVVFGEVVAGWEVLDRIESVEVKDEVPQQAIVVVAAGRL